MITDWDDAYENGTYIENAEEIIASWTTDSAAFRKTMIADRRALLNASYGKHPRETTDFFFPKGKPKGLMVFVHGGYWRSLDKDMWSHLAAGAIAKGWAVALPGYVLCPEVQIADITRQIARAVDKAAERISGPIHLVGHSAGGHLVARMVCNDITLNCFDRIKRVVPVSGVFDLRPLLRTKMNFDFRMNTVEAELESPLLLTPREGVKVTAWVGADERPEFVRQNAALANVWSGCAVDITCVEEADHNHFTVIGSLKDEDGSLTEVVVG